MKQIQELLIEKIAFGGAGLGRTNDGKRCFVHGTIPGEKVYAEITKDKTNFSEGFVEELIEKSPLRENAPCAQFLRPGTFREACPGCAFQHVPYEKELAWKQEQFRDFLVRGGLAEESVISDAVGAPERFFWRNRIRMTVGQDGRLGYRGFDNRTVIAV